MTKQNKSSKELIGASTGILVLTVLAREASYGYDIVKQINVEADGHFTWQEGTVYPVLHKLEKDELVRTQWQQSEKGRQRKYYYITETGRDSLEKRKQEWTSVDGLIHRLGEV